NLRKKFALELAHFGNRLFAGKEPLAWCGITVPFDLLNALGVNACFVEFLGAVLSASGQINDILESAEQDGFSPDTCGYHRAVYGAARQGLVPTPNFLIGSSVPCTGGQAVMERLSSQFKKDLFMLQIPQVENARNVAFLAHQFSEMVSFVETHLRKKLDRECLRNSIRLSNEMRALLVELFELASHNPSPVKSKELANFALVVNLMSGTQAGVDLVRNFKNEYARRIRESQCSPSKLRLLWLQNRIQFKNGLLDILENEYQATIVIDELNDVTWDPIDPDNPFIGMAKRSISIPFNGPFTNRLNHLKTLIARYQVDGVINPCNWGCRQGAGSRGLMEQAMREMSIPIINLEVDCVDSRGFGEGQLRTRLEAFLETASARSGRG
ncbi:MAG: 2-hydroxyacyl-CoA dehydratase, partial [Bdellovibrio sp.]|nr:2-hydroxyacyl-CoA dehydratase [Bdellovibrio sp.]